MRSRIRRAAWAWIVLVLATASTRGGGAALLRRFRAAHGGAPEVPIALYLVGGSSGARGRRESAALTSRELALLAPASAYADGAADRLRGLGRAGLTLPPFSVEERL